MRPGAMMAEVTNRQRLQGHGRMVGTALRTGGNHPETGFFKKQNFDTL